MRLGVGLKVTAVWRATMATGEATLSKLDTSSGRTIVVVLQRSDFMLQCGVGLVVRLIARAIVRRIVRLGVVHEVRLGVVHIVRLRVRSEVCLRVRRVMRLGVRLEVTTVWRAAVTTMTRWAKVLGATMERVKERNVREDFLSL
jgi:hypothetical protein